MTIITSARTLVIDKLFNSILIIALYKVNYFLFRYSSYLSIGFNLLDFLQKRNTFQVDTQVSDHNDVCNWYTLNTQNIKVF